MLGWRGCDLLLHYRLHGLGWHIEARWQSARQLTALHKVPLRVMFRPELSSLQLVHMKLLPLLDQLLTLIL